MGILNRATVGSDATPHFIRRGRKAQRDQPWMRQCSFDSRLQLAEMQLVACFEPWWRSTIFRASAVIAGAEHYSREALQITRRERGLTSQPNLDDSTGADMNAMQARR